MPATKKLAALFSFITAFTMVYGQRTKPILNQEVYVPVSSTLNEAIQLIESSTHCNVAYDPKRISIQQESSEACSPCNVKTLLGYYQNPAIVAKQAGNVLVLSTPDSASIYYESHPTYTISGVVRNKETGHVIAKTAVYDVHSREYAITDAAGYFAFDVFQAKQEPVLAIRNQAYSDTVIVVSSRKSNYQIMLTPLPQPLTLEKDSLPQMLTRDIAPYIIENDQRTLVDQIRTPAYNYVTLGLVPGINTAQFYPGATSVHASINGLVGYNYDVQGLQLSGLVGISRFDMVGIQVGGLAANTSKDALGVGLGGLYSFVGGRTRGVFAGGLAQVSIDSAMGVHAAGMYSHVNKSLLGIQASGLGAYVAGRTTGVQAGGFFAYSDSVFGIQAGGFGAIAKSHVTGLQLGGFTTSAQSVHGIQTAGFMCSSTSYTNGQFAGVINTAKSMDGLQMAGLINRGRYVNGAQVGLLNVSKKVNGVQIGLVNISDTINGVALGLLNFSKSGFNRAVFSIDHNAMHSLEYQSGTRWLNSRLLFGFNAPHNLKVVGYGLGVNLPMGKSWNIDLEGKATTYLSNSWQHQGLHIGYAGFAIERKIVNWLWINAGLRAGALVSENQHNEKLEYFSILRDEETVIFNGWSVFPFASGQFSLIFSW